MLYSDRIHETGRFTYMHLRSFKVVFLIYYSYLFNLFMINEGKQDMYFSTMFSIFSILLTHIRSMYGTLTQIHYKNQLNVDRYSVSYMDGMGNELTYFPHPSFRVTLATDQVAVFAFGAHGKCDESLTSFNQLTPPPPKTGKQFYGGPTRKSWLELRWNGCSGVRLPGNKPEFCWVACSFLGDV